MYYLLVLVFIFGFLVGGSFAYKGFNDDLESGYVKGRNSIVYEVKEIKEE